MLRTVSDRRVQGEPGASDFSTHDVDILMKTIIYQIN
jgi:hypothetical protein